MGKKRTKVQETKEYRVPFRLTLEGDLFVEAASADEARAIAEQSGWEDTSFCDRASFVDWEVMGEPKED